MNNGINGSINKKIDKLSDGGRVMDRYRKLVNLKLYGVNATVIIFVFVLYCIVEKQRKNLVCARCGEEEQKFVRKVISTYFAVLHQRSLVTRQGRHGKSYVWIAADEV